MECVSRGQEGCGVCKQGTGGRWTDHEVRLAQKPEVVESRPEGGCVGGDTVSRCHDVNTQLRMRRDHPLAHNVVSRGGAGAGGAQRGEGQARRGRGCSLGLLRSGAVCSGIWSYARPHTHGLSIVCTLVGVQVLWFNSPDNPAPLI